MDAANLKLLGDVLDKFKADVMDSCGVPSDTFPNLLRMSHLLLLCASVWERETCIQYYPEGIVVAPRSEPPFVVSREVGESWYEAITKMPSNAAGLYIFSSLVRVVRDTWPAELPKLSHF